jgi:hypothetical protein
MEEAIMSEREKGVSRRTVLLAAAGAVPVLAMMTGSAQALMAQAAAGYKPEAKVMPDGTKRDCEGCNFFLPSADAGKPGKCKMVDGDISPTGYCNLWVKKPA